MQILKLLSAERPQWIGVSEIARRCDLSKASAHRFLLALLAENLVLRHPRDITYTLGPGLFELAGAAEKDGPLLEILRDALTELSIEIRASTEAFQTLVDGTTVCIASCAGPGPIFLNRPVGSRIPVSPMVTLLPHAWTGQLNPDLLKQELVKAGDDPYPGVEIRIIEDLIAARRVGFTWVAGNGENTPENLSQIARWVDELADLGLARQSKDDRRSQINEITHYTTLRNERAGAHLSALPVLGVIGPVFDHAGRVQFQICAVFLMAQVAPKNLHTIGKIVLQKADHVSRRIGGFRPTE